MGKQARIVLAVFLIRGVFSACIFPTVFKESTWIDNTKGNVTFTTWEMKGWKFRGGNKDISDWEIVDNTRFDSDSADDEHGYLALRAHDSFEDNGNTYYSFICLKFYQLSDGVYKYYRLHDASSIAGGERVILHTTDSLTRFDEICDTTYTYNEAHYGILLKKGSDPKSTCPNPILGRFDYTIENKDGNKSCDADEALWDGCTANKIVELNYTSCPALVGYSATGKLTCMDSMEYDKQNHYYQVLLYNLDESVDNVNTFWFSCIRVTEDGKEMSVAPSYCRAGQTPYDFPQENGENIGQKLTTTALSHCRIYPTQKDEGGLSTDVIIAIGVVAGVVVLVITIIIIIVCLRRRG